MEAMPQSVEWLSLGIGTLIAIIRCGIWSRLPLKIVADHDLDNSGGEQWVVIGFIILSLISRFILGQEVTDIIGLVIIPIFLLFSLYAIVRLLSS